MAEGRFIAYYRVSTDRQGKSGLGLEAQRQAVIDYLDGGRWELVGEHTEIESGRRSDRPELARALEGCRRQKAVLIIAKLDRLARNVAFIANLMESGVDFVAVDFPQANKLTIHILAAVAAPIVIGDIVHGRFAFFGAGASHVVPTTIETRNHGTGQASAHRRQE